MCDIKVLKNNFDLIKAIICWELKMGACIPYISIKLGGGKKKPLHQEVVPLQCLTKNYEAEISFTPKSHSQILTLVPTRNFPSVSTSPSEDK